MLQNFAVVYTVEFQKRGLPHAHVCLFLHKDDKIPSADQIDKYISAEIPDKDEDPDLYKLVSDFMMHGPCGEDEPKQVCMDEGRCTKHFPKKFTQRSSVDAEGYPVYRRRDDEKYVERTVISCITVMLFRITLCFSNVINATLMLSGVTRPVLSNICLSI